MFISRWTTEYIDHEDRLQISGEDESGQIQRIWVTRRLLERLLPLLTGWIEERFEGRPHGAALLQWEQAAAGASLANNPTPPVVAKQDGWLVHSVDVNRGPENIELLFKEGAREPFGLKLPPQAMRQWLAVVHGQVERAQWGLPVWPDWIGGAHSATDAQKAHLH